MTDSKKSLANSGKGPANFGKGPTNSEKSSANYGERPTNSDPKKHFDAKGLRTLTSEKSPTFKSASHVRSLANSEKGPANSGKGPTNPEKSSANYGERPANSDKPCKFKKAPLCCEKSPRSKRFDFDFLTFFFSGHSQVMLTAQTPLVAILPITSHSSNHLSFFQSPLKIALSLLFQRLCSFPLVFFSFCKFFLETLTDYAYGVV